MVGERPGVSWRETGDWPETNQKVARERLEMGCRRPEISLKSGRRDRGTAGEKLETDQRETGDRTEGWPERYGDWL